MNDPNRTQLGAPPTLDPNRTVMGTAPSLNATQTIKPVQCPVCKTFNPVGVMFCVECGLIFDRALPGDAFGAPAIQLPVLVDTNGREHPIRPGVNVVGREGDIIVAEPKVSRRHAQVTSENGTITIEDLGSTNGTFVNGNKLNPGDKVTLEPGHTVSFAGAEHKLSLPAETNRTAILNPTKTAAMPAAPRVVAAPAFLVFGDQKLPLKEGLNTFGRKAENDVPIPDGYVSGKHGVIELVNGEFYLTDVGSTNGTAINDARLSPNMRTRLTPDDEIRIGSLVLRVELAESGA